MWVILTYFLVSRGFIKYQLRYCYQEEPFTCARLSQSTQYLLFPSGPRVGHLWRQEGWTKLSRSRLENELKKGLFGPVSPWSAGGTLEVAGEGIQI